jgi:hypothetical protein
MIHNPLTLTLITSTTPSLPSKSFSMTDGKLVKASSADLSAGHARLIACSGLTEFDTLLNTLSGDQALTFGIAPGHPDATVRTADKLREGDIARTKEYFRFAEAPGILMLDHDNTVDGVPINADDLRARLLEAVPELGGASMLWRVSASSCITNAATGEEMNGVKGQRLYIPVQDASQIPAAGKALVARLWASGMGWIEVGKAGQALKRTLVDDSVWQANRLDFAGPPELSADLIRTTPASRIFGDPDVLFDLRLITADAATMRKATNAQTAAKDKAKSALSVARTAYIALKAPELAKHRGITEEAAQSVLRGATAHNILVADFELLAQDGTIVTVGELLDEPEKWDGQNFADPLEPDYGGCNRTVARAHLGTGVTCDAV